MYTQKMARAFRSLDNHCPKGFSVELIDNEHFITIKTDPDQLEKMDDFTQRRAVEYLAKVYRALTEEGAVVMLTRKAVEK